MNRTFTELFESVVTSYNNRELLNYEDLRDIIAQVEKQKTCLKQHLSKCYQDK